MKGGDIMDIEKGVIARCNFRETVTAYVDRCGMTGKSCCGESKCILWNIYKRAK